MGSNRRNRKRREARGPAIRSPRRLLLVVCEGKVTEPSYIRGFVRKARNATVEVRIHDERGDPRRLVEMAKRENEQARARARRHEDELLAYDEVWCVFDRDQHERFADACQMARDNQLELAVSNPCFELWLLLHFRDSPGAQHRHRLQKMLGKLLPGYDKHFDFEHVAGGAEQATERAPPRPGCRELGRGVSQPHDRRLPAGRIHRPRRASDAGRGLSPASSPVGAHSFTGTLTRRRPPLMLWSDLHGGRFLQ